VEKRKKIKNDDPKQCDACGLDLDYLESLKSRALDNGVALEFTKALAKEHGFSAGRNLFELDHKEPLWDGGEDKKGNTRWLCYGCHRAKTSSEATVRSFRRKFEPDQSSKYNRECNEENHTWRLKKKVNGAVVRVCKTCRAEHR